MHTDKNHFKNRSNHSGHPMKGTWSSYLLAVVLVVSLPVGFLHCLQSRPIDRQTLVNRHNVVLDHVDTLGALTLGNGAFAMTVDVTGLQSFPDAYNNGIPLGTQAEWGWHSMPNVGNYRYEETLDTFFTCDDHGVSYSTQSGQGRRGEAVQWFRSNPHRLQLGRIGLKLLRKDGSQGQIEDLQNIHQKLDLWNGVITSSFEFDGVQTEVQTLVLPDNDAVAFRVTSALIQEGRLQVQIAFPYAKSCAVCPGYDWDHPELHASILADSTSHSVKIKRVLDATEYFTNVDFTGASCERKGLHEYTLLPNLGNDFLEATVLFGREIAEADPFTFEASKAKTESAWHAFWQSGGAADFSKCSDPRAVELERRVILSQYLTRIQCAGTMPPQETGLTSNSWYGKAHLEMHWWHGVHFALWGRPEYLEKSLSWYEHILGQAHSIANRQGYDGLRWPKMVGPEGISSPSSVGEFLIWQQPHPIYFAEQMYRWHPDRPTLERYQDLVFQTAEFMASFARRDTADGLYHLCPPLIPAQEIFPAEETRDPGFELAYWYWGLQMAQTWRQRLNLEPDHQWAEVLGQLAPLPQAEGKYLPSAASHDDYLNPDKRRDHPIVTGILGVLPQTAKVDPALAENTYQEVKLNWQWETTWGWDFPMLAMAAARLGHPEDAIDWLLMDAPKNTYLNNGHNYQDQRLKLYLPGNGGLLTAVAMMAAGWDGAQGHAPGFPKNGKWTIQWEGLERMP